jgi:hypothetical protein
MARRNKFRPPFAKILLAQSIYQFPFFLPLKNFIMKTRNAFLKSRLLCCVLTAMLLASCSKEESVTQLAKESLTTQNLDIPAEIAMYLTESEKAEFYANKPNYTPASAGVNERDKIWHPFFVSGSVAGSKLPVLGNCDVPAAAEICPFEDCIEEELWTGYAALLAGKATMTGVGEGNQFYSSFVCGIENKVETGLISGSYKKGNGELYWRPVERTFKTQLNADGTVSIDWQVNVCNAAAPDPLCLSYSSGDFKNVEGNGTVNYRLIGSPNNFLSEIFEPFTTSHLMGWGWLYY